MKFLNCDLRGGQVFFVMLETLFDRNNALKWGVIVVISDFSRVKEEKEDEEEKDPDAADRLCAWGHGKKFGARCDVVEEVEEEAERYRTA